MRRDGHVRARILPRQEGHLVQADHAVRQVRLQLRLVIPGKPALDEGRQLRLVGTPPAWLARFPGPGTKQAPQPVLIHRRRVQMVQWVHSPLSALHGQIGQVSAARRKFA